jgi:hypothetical protein
MNQLKPKNDELLHRFNGKECGMKDEPAEAKNDELLHWFNGKDVI